MNASKNVIENNPGKGWWEHSLILTNSCSKAVKRLRESDCPGPKAPVLPPVHGFTTAHNDV